jgi:hypothetical protein
MDRFGHAVSNSSSTVACLFIAMETCFNKLVCSNGHLIGENSDYLDVMSQCYMRPCNTLGGYMMASHHGKLWFNSK